MSEVGQQHEQHPKPGFILLVGDAELSAQCCLLRPTAVQDPLVCSVDARIRRVISGNMTKGVEHLRYAEGVADKIDHLGYKEIYQFLFAVRAGCTLLVQETCRISRYRCLVAVKLFFEVRAYARVSVYIEREKVLKAEGSDDGSASGVGEADNLLVPFYDFELVDALVLRFCSRVQRVEALFHLGDEVLVPGLIAAHSAA